MNSKIKKSNILYDIFKILILFLFFIFFEVFTFKESLKTKDVALCVIAKNENLYIKEYVEYCKLHSSISNIMEFKSFKEISNFFWI